MKKEIKISFNNLGLRSFIEVDLCPECPRQDGKGCCGYYSPVFYPADFVYWLNTQPDMIDFLFQLPYLTVLDSSVTVNSPPEGSSYRCAMHDTEKGCRIPQLIRESVCRHFVCPGIDWLSDCRLQTWKKFFDQLADYEIQLNNTISQIMQQENLSLRLKKQRPLYFQRIKVHFDCLTENPPSFLTSCPPYEEFWLKRQISYGKEWPL